MNKIIINNKEYNVGNGKNIIIDNNSIIVDGDVVESNLHGEVKIKFEGDLANLNADYAVINGNIKGGVDCTSLKCNNIDGDVDCTSLNCNDIKGDVDCTSLKCNNVNGNVKAKNVNVNTINM